MKNIKLSTIAFDAPHMVPREDVAKLEAEIAELKKWQSDRLSEACLMRENATKVAMLLLQTRSAIVAARFDLPLSAPETVATSLNDAHRMVAEVLASATIREGIACMMPSAFFEAAFGKETT